MNESVLVHFVAPSDESYQLTNEVSKFINENFHFIESSTTPNSLIITCKVSSEYLSIIRLSSDYLYKRSVISYIDDSLKDRYREKDK